MVLIHFASTVLLSPMGRIPSHRSCLRRSRSRSRGRSPASTLPNAGERLPPPNADARCDAPIAAWPRQLAAAAVVHLGCDGELARTQAQQFPGEGKGARAIASSPLSPVLLLTYPFAVPGVFMRPLPSCMVRDPTPRFRFGLSLFYLQDSLHPHLLPPDDICPVARSNRGQARVLVAFHPPIPMPSWIHAL